MCGSFSCKNHYETDHLIHYALRPLPGLPVLNIACMLPKLGCLCRHDIPIHFRIKRLQMMYVHICTMFTEKFTEKKAGKR